MAPYSILSKVPYGEYLQQNLFVRDIKGQIHQSATAVSYAVTEQTRSVVASTGALQRSFGSGFDALNNTIADGFRWLSSGLDDIQNSVEDMRADFSYGMSLLLEALQAQNKTLTAMVEHLDQIHQTLQSPSLTQSREQYRIGCERMSKGLLDKALEALLAAEQKNDTDFLLQLKIGKLYLYGKDDDDNVVNLAEAERHLRMAIRYGKADLSQMPALDSLVADACFHGAISCYAQAGELHRSGQPSADWPMKVKEALVLAEQAKQLLADSPETIYHMAKFCSLLGDTDAAVENLSKCISFDRNYCLKAGSDRDFDPCRNRVEDLFVRLQASALDEAREAYVRVQQLLSGYHWDPQVESEHFKVEMCLKEGVELIKSGTYFDLLDTLAVCREAQAAFDGTPKEHVIPIDQWPQVETQRRRETERVREAEVKRIEMERAKRDDEARRQATQAAYERRQGRWSLISMWVMWGSGALLAIWFLLLFMAQGTVSVCINGVAVPRDNGNYRPYVVWIGSGVVHQEGTVYQSCVFTTDLQAGKYNLKIARIRAGHSDPSGMVDTTITVRFGRHAYHCNAWDDGQRLSIQSVGTR